MLSKKILIDGAEAYAQLNKNPAGEVSLYWIINSVLRRLNLVRVNHDFITDVMKYEYLLEAFEIVNLNGFDYTIDDPDYSLIETAPISAERVGSSLAIPDASFQAPSTLSPVTSVSLFPFNSAFVLNFKAQEGIVDFVNGTIRQPFNFTHVSTHETAEAADDGSITVNDAWGGAAPLEYSVDNGATWQGGNAFIGLAPGTYFVKIKTDIDESIAKEVIIEQFVAV